MTTHLQSSQNLGLNPKNATTNNGMNIIPASLMAIMIIGSLYSSLPVDAQSVFPASYTATPGDGVAQGGSYNYYDNTGNQLTDGIYGINDWSANLGNGNAYEWVGWRAADPLIALQFSTPVTINQVGIDFNRNQSASIFLPTTVTIGGTDFTVDPNAIPDNTRGTLYFDGNWIGSSLMVNLTDSIGCTTRNWVFVDEITLSTASTAVPEPSVFGIMAGGFGLLILGLRRRNSVRHF